MHSKFVIECGLSFSPNTFAPIDCMQCILLHRLCGERLVLLRLIVPSFGTPWRNKKIIKHYFFIFFKEIFNPASIKITVLKLKNTWAPSSEFVSSSIPSWQILTAHAQPFRGARDLAFCLKVPFDSLLLWASSEGSGETARMRRLAWTFAARIDYKYQIRLTRSTFHWVVIGNNKSINHIYRDMYIF